MPICRSCGVTGQPSDWGRYARNGRLKVLCPGCDQRKEAARKRTEAAQLCAYCGVRLIRKQTDHMIPLALGGEHSLRNIVIVCPDCNARKAGLSYAEWVDRVEPQHRQRVLALYHERYARWSGGPSGSLQAPRGGGWKCRTLWVAPAHDLWLTS